MNSVILKRDHYLPERVVFVDGLSGSGKTALSFIISCLERVEVHKIEPIYEQLCILNFLGKIPTKTAVELIKLQTDISCYDSLIARNANFRPTDASSVLLKKDLYTKRLEMKDGSSVLQRIKDERPILHLMTHQCASISSPLFQALEDRCYFFEMVRNPLFLITAWHTYIDRYGKDPLEFDFCIDYKGNAIPWFTKGWEDEFFKLPKMDRIIHCLKNILDQKKTFVDNLPQNIKDRFHIIPFKYLVTDPWPYIEKIESLLNVKRTPLLDQVLKQQNIPRKFINDVPDSEAYKRYGWVAGAHKTSEEVEIQNQWNFIRKEASTQAIKILEALVEKFEQSYYGAN